jgi:hypothetical protein
VDVPVNALPLVVSGERAEYEAMSEACIILQGCK